MTDRKTLPQKQQATVQTGGPLPAAGCRLPGTTGTNYFCPVCRHEFLPEEIGKKPYCRRCGYLES